MSFEFPAARKVSDLTTIELDLTNQNWSLAASRAYCRRLARRHYENFVVGSCLLPRELRQHFYNVYAYCRWSDDLADEVAGAERSLELLDQWETELLQCYRGQATHPVFIALAQTIAEFEIPSEPFRDLLVAFRQDQVKQRYGSRDELLEYCRYSANPVGRIVLYLARRPSQETFELSDSICSGLQLANFWQDVARDWDRGRRYLPDETLKRFGCTEGMFHKRSATDEFRAALEHEVAVAERMLRDGLPLVRLVPAPLQIDVWLFAQGGLATLEEIRKVDFDVWSRRPTVSRAKQLRLLTTAWWRQRAGGLIPRGE